MYANSNDGNYSRQSCNLADRYELLSVIGEGGFGVVYKARHSMMGRTVAIKLLHEAAPDDLLTRRFQLEAQAAANLSHTNIVTVHDFGVSARNQLFLVMDFVEGTDLDKLLEAVVRIDPSRAVPLFIQTCEALGHAHRRGIIHRDLKPSNIMLMRDEDGRDVVKVVDFGLAKLLREDNTKLTQTGDLLGTPLYMSPEQCLGEASDRRSDIYSLGCIMYHALTGQLPLEGKNVMATLYQQISAPPLPFAKCAAGLSIPHCLEKIVLKCLQKSPAARYQSMSELAADLRRVQDSMSPASHAGVRPRVRRGAVPAIAAVAAVLLAIAAFAFVMVARPDKSHPSSGNVPLNASDKPAGKPSAPEPAESDSPPDVPESAPQAPRSPSPAPKPTKTRTTIATQRPGAPEPAPSRPPESVPLLSPEPTLGRAYPPESAHYDPTFDPPAVYAPPSYAETPDYSPSTSSRGRASKIGRWARTARQLVDDYSATIDSPSPQSPLPSPAQKLTKYRHLLKHLVPDEM